MVRFVWAGWQEVFRRYWCLSVGSVCVEISFYLAIVEMDLCIWEGKTLA